MINEQKEKATLNKMSDLEYAKNDVEMMRYRANALSSKLGIFGMIASLLGAFMCLNSFRPHDFQIFIIIMLNIVILLGGFLACEKAKNYSKIGSIFQIIFGAVCIGRMFYIPLMLIRYYNIYKKGNTAKGYAKAVENLGNSIKAKDTSSYAHAFFPSSGTARGITAMILFAIAGGLFIAAGVIGYLRSQKLTKYLNSINEKK
ncbi:MAG: hypothetical protein K6E20_03310 [Acholeplasmatales bacterium]|nr:hypothetical protein [Acholeplasmatales bacterium]